VHSDADDMIRRVPMSFTVDGEQVPSMAAELVARASEPTSDPVFARLPRPTPDMLILNFQGGADDVPTYSLADLAACAAKDDKDFFKRNFGGKIVLIGTLLDVEDPRSRRSGSPPRRKARGRSAARCRSRRRGKDSPATRSPASISMRRR
jgi:adenylate cyclase/guanylate cyclase